MKASMPLSVSGCLTSCLITDGGAVITSRDLGGLEHVHRVTDAGDQDLGGEIVIVVDQGMSSIRSMPSKPISSCRPTNGEMKVAPALAASSAWWREAEA